MTDAGIEARVKKQMKELGAPDKYDVFSNNCGMQVKTSFLACCLQDPTPANIVYDFSWINDWMNSLGGGSQNFPSGF